MPAKTPRLSPAIAALSLGISLLVRAPTGAAQSPSTAAPAPAPAPTTSPVTEPPGPRTAGRYLVGQPIPPDGERPTSEPGALRSHRAPVSVHFARGTPVATVLAAHEAAVRALDVLEHAQHFPLPAPDGARGGGPELDVYLVPPDGGADSIAGDAVLDALEYGSLWDRASAFVRVHNTLTGDALTRAVTEGVTQASLLGMDARAPRAWRVALAAALADRSTLLGPDLAAVARFQRDPGRPLFAHRDDASARGASLFVNYLASRFDDGSLALLRGLAWAPVARTHEGATTVFNDEPDFFDLLERLVRDERGGIDGLLADFALVRARAGSVEDSLAGWNESSQELRPDATALEYAQLPTRVVPARPTDETGAFYLSVRTPPSGNHGINLWFHGAPWRRWNVTAVRLDAQDREVGRSPASRVDRGEWSVGLASLSDTTRVLVVVTDLGNGDYDPDEIADRTGFFSLTLSRDE